MKKRLFAAARAAEVQRIPIPKDLRGVEIASVVRAPDGNALFLIDALAGGSEEPVVSWGMLLVDFAHHAAQALTHRLQKEDGSFVEREEILAAIKEVFDAEWANRTDEVEELRRFTEGNEDDEPS